MPNVINFKDGPQDTAHLAASLRLLADAVDRGDVLSYVGCVAYAEDATDEDPNPPPFTTSLTYGWPIFMPALMVHLDETVEKRITIGI